MRRERRRFAAAPRRQRVDHRQGRHRPGLAGGGDHGARRQNTSQLYQKLTETFGNPAYERVDAPADAAQRKALSKLSGEQVKSATLAGEKIDAVLTRAPGNDAAIGGVKVVTASGWFAARPSGTESIYKIYAESMRGPEHLQQIFAEAQQIVTAALGSVSKA